MRIDREDARSILEEEAAKALLDPGPKKWQKVIKDLETACGDSNLTFFAALMTAMLAKCTQPTVDVFSLQSSSSDRGYSARSLCQHVVAASAPRLRIDIGVTGREPLNNQPFFAKSKISSDLPVKPAARNALHILLSALSDLQNLKTSQAKGALRAFISTRIKRQQTWQLNSASNTVAGLRKFSQLVDQFVSNKSEHGKRAQAVAAGFLDTCFGSELVHCGRVHDPDVQFPGDVVIMRELKTESIIWSFEVRDKIVLGADLYHFAEKLHNFNCQSGAVVCPVNKEIAEEVEDAITWAEVEKKILLKAFPTWFSFFREVVFWHPSSSETLLSKAPEMVFKRLQSLEISEEGLKTWRDAFTPEH